jgi:hypothetical protein
VTSQDVRRYGVNWRKDERSLRGANDICVHLTKTASLLAKKESAPALKGCCYVGIKGIAEYSNAINAPNPILAIRPSNHESTNM